MFQIETEGGYMIKNFIKGIIVIASIPVFLLKGIMECIKINNGYYKCYYNEGYFLMKG